MCALSLCLLTPASNRVWAQSAGMQGQGKQASILLGGAQAPRATQTRIDPRLPRGEVRRLPSVSPSAWSAELSKDVVRRCSLKRPVCVETAQELLGRISAQQQRRSLADLERAFEELKFGAALPMYGPSFQQPLSWRLQPSSFEVQAVLSPARAFDRGVAFCLGGALELETARRCVAEAAIVETAPATASWLRAGYSAAVARELGEAPLSKSQVASARSQPEAGSLVTDAPACGAEHEPQCVSSFLPAQIFFDFLQARSPAPLGHVGYLALSLAATNTPAGNLRYQAEPDLLDVLSASVANNNTALARLLNEAAQYNYESAVLNGQTTPQLAWDISGDSLPRSLALPRPLVPTGSAYVRVLLNKKQRQSTIAFQMKCESPVSYQWSVLRFNEQKKRLPSVPFGYAERSAQVSGRVSPLAGTSELLLVGTNIGGIDLAHPFDPDHGPHEAHGCQVYIVELKEEAEASGDDSSLAPTAPPPKKK